MIELNEKERGICLIALIKMQAFWRYVSPMTWVNVPDEEIEGLINKLGLPGTDEVMLVCLMCGYTQLVKVSDYRANIAYGGQPYTCPDHSQLPLEVGDLVENRKVE